LSQRAIFPSARWTPKQRLWIIGNDPIYQIGMPIIAQHFALFRKAKAGLIPLAMPNTIKRV
jgi:hypothetical protein